MSDSTKGAREYAYAAGAEAMADAIRRMGEAMRDQLELEHDTDVPPYTPSEVAQLFERFTAKTVMETRDKVMSGNPFVLQELSEADIRRLRNGLPRIVRAPADEPLASRRKARPKLPSPGQRPVISGSDA